MVKAVQKCGGGVYDVRVITLPKYDLFDTQLSGRQITFLNKFTDTPEPVDADAVYGILAAPTCTMFSLARNNAKTPRDFDLPDGWTARAARRSMTSACFAEAFFMANT